LAWQPFIASARSIVPSLITVLIGTGGCVI
jgi:hypothetical protein